mgnify:CR=1 FL=1
MQNGIIIDVNEEVIHKLNPDLLAILLYDRTTRKNILWATNDYSDLGIEYNAGSEIKSHLITGVNVKIIRPRVMKAAEKKEGRTVILE